MKTSVMPEKKAIRNEILPFKVRKALIGLELDSIDDKLLKYIKFFTTQVPVGTAYFLHVLPRPDLFNIFNEEDLFAFGGVDKDKTELDEMTRKVVRSFAPDTKIRLKMDVHQGSPLEELLEKAEDVKVDLVVIGQNTEGGHHHGILSKNFARQVWSNALIVPDKAKLSLKKILVPVDFSVNSAEALHTAIAINKGLEKKAVITVLNVYDMPGNYSAYRINRDKVMAMIKEDRESALQSFIQENVPDAELKYVKTSLLEHNHSTTGQHLVSFAEAHKNDLIIMGAKGHSKVALLLMGSVTEKVITLSNNIPVMIVK